MRWVRWLTSLNISAKRKITQFLTLLISNLGVFRILKTGLVCPFLYCHGCPFSLLGCPIGIIQQFIAFGQPPLFTLGLIGIYGTFFGRAFCGWACPFGALQDLLSYVRSGKTIRTRNHWYVKYVVLAFVVVSSWITLDTVFCKFCPSGSLFAAIPFRLVDPSLGFGKFFYIHMVTLAVTVFLVLAISHFWCRYLCPLGALTGFFNKVSVLAIRFDGDRCRRCKVCLNFCEMGIDKIEDIGYSTDCTLCGRCVENCPEKALSFSPKL